MQLVMPDSRRSKICKLAYESVFDSHMEFRQAKDKIQYNSFCRKCQRYIARFCNICEAMSDQRSKHISDAKPITEIGRIFLH